MAARITALMERTPVRLRVTLVFTAVMAVLLVAAGAILDAEFGRTLTATVDRGLRGRADEVAALVAQADAGLSEAPRGALAERAESFAQILDSRGRVVDAPPALRRRPLLSPAELRRAARRTVVLEHARSPLDGDRVRLLATPTHAQDQRLIVVVGSSLEATAEARARLRTLLLIGGPIALLLAALAGYGAAAGALRPVERMRRRAAEIRASRLSRRLPVPRSHDEVARLGETLNEMLDRLEGSFARERAFVADTSHELRTPLSVLRGELELALRTATDVEAFRSAVASAMEETDRLAQLAEDLLVIARADGGRLPVRTEPVAVAAALEAVRGRFAGRAAQHGMPLGVAPVDGLAVQADPARLEQALGNLVDNALRHGAGSVQLGAQPAGDRVRLHVRDAGPGFADGFLPRAFERFTRGDPGRGGAGAGLGLAIVAAIAEAHGGRAGAGPGPGGGAEAWVELPSAAAPGGPPGAATGLGG